MINTVQASSSLLLSSILLSQTNYILSEKLLASTRLLISAPIVVNISNLKMFKGAQAHNVQIEMILWDSCLSFNSKWRHSWNELKLICLQLDYSKSIQLNSGVGLKYLKEIPQRDNFSRTTKLSLVSFEWDTILLFWYHIIIIYPR